MAVSAPDTRQAYFRGACISLSKVSIILRSHVEQTVFEYILPLPVISTSSATKDKEVDESAWTDRLLHTIGYLGGKAMDFLISLSGLKAT